MSIKSELYKLLVDTLESLVYTDENNETQPVFKFVGHYNGQDLDNDNNFAYDTPAIFINFNQINWIHLKHETESFDLTREADGTIQFSLHYFFHDLRTDSDSFLDHLEIIDQVYYEIIGLRSDDSIEGKISSCKRIRETDDTANNNLRHWISVYETRLQETAKKAGKTDASQVELEIKIIKSEPTCLVGVNDNDCLGFNDYTGKIKTNN